VATSSILIKHADSIVTLNSKREIIQDGAVYIEGNNIRDVGPTAHVVEAHPMPDEVIDAKGKAVFPGFVNTHTHLFQIMLKGLGNDRILADWIRTIIVPSSRKLTYKQVHASALLGVVEGIKSGITTTLDFMYAHPIPKLSEAVLQAFQESGIRGIVGHGIIDTGLDVGLPQEIIHEPDEAFDEIRRLHRNCVEKGDGMLGVWLAPVAIWGVTETALKGCRGLANELGIGITMHVAETPFEVENCKSRFRCKELELFDKIGFLGPDVLAVHCVYFDDDDIRIMKKSNAKVSHNAASNMYLSSGIAPIPQMLRSGITVGLGVDGAASNNNQDMLQLLKVTALLHKVAHPGNPTIMTAEDVLEMATIGGARALGLEKEVGSIEAEKKADLFLIDLSGIFVAPAHNPVSALVYSATSENIDTTIVNGQVLMKGRKMILVDEDEVLSEARAAADELVDISGISNLKNRSYF
jgi:5-methylthioadenosine/S-adenosylhomocysteine deaminase